MRTDFLWGLAWLLLAGIPQGAFTLPMKFVRRWKWEQLWLSYSLLAFFILPVLFAWITVPRLGEVYQHCSGRVVALTAGFGAGWGIGSIFFGLGVDALGMALGFSMMTGIYTALGAIVPLAVLTPELVWSRQGACILAGNAVTIAGVAVAAVAGDLRDRQSPDRSAPALGRRFSFRTGLLICIAGGVFSAMFNFSYAFGKPIVDVAQRMGASRDGAQNALWLLTLVSGGSLNVAYCLECIRRRRSWLLLWRGAASRDLLHALSMAGMWTGSVLVYSWGADRLGQLGPSLGWSLFNVILIITTVACGLLAKEWAGVRGRPLHLLLWSIAALILATVLLGLGGAGV